MSGRRAVCHFYQQGSCRYGDKCRFYHPPRGQAPVFASHSASGQFGGGSILGRQDARQAPAPRAGGGKDVCRFFAQNKWCKFGDQCKYLHSVGGGDVGERRDARGGRHQGDPSVNFRNQWGRKEQNRFEYFNGGSQTGDFGSQQSARDFGSRDRQSSSREYGSSSMNLFSTPNKSERVAGRGRQRWSSQSEQHVDLTDPANIAPAIIEDVAEWQGSGMWPLSCYTFVKEGHNMPGFADHSPEELRWDAYQAITSGAATRYTDLVKSLVETQAKLWREYLSISPADITKLLPSLQSSPSTVTQLPVFAATSNSSVSSLFGSAQPLFGSPPSPTGVTFPRQPVTGQGMSLFGSPGSGLGTLTLPPRIEPGSQAVSGPPVAPTSASAVGASGGDLTDGELQAYKADKFSSGHIPEQPPPQVLC